jgi:quercetin dioxygenase-like cupin family protein
LRILRSKKKWLAGTFGVAVIGTLAAVALGSPPFNFVGEPPLVTADFDGTTHVNSDRVKLQTKGPTDVRVQKINVAPGGFSGWHHHPGIVIVTVASGTLTFTKSDCSSKTYGPGHPNGAVFVEAGDDPGQASSTTGATLYATYIAPSADPPVFRIEDPVQPC